MKTFYLTLLVLFLAPTLIFSQKLDVGLFIGSSNYKGDINKADYLLVKESQFAYGVQAEYHIWDKVGIEGNFVMGKISGDDRNFEDRKDWASPVDFESSFMEFLAKVNIYPFRSRKLHVFDEDGEKFSHKMLDDSENVVFDQNGNLIQKYRSVYVATDSLNNEWIYNSKGDYVVMDSEREVIKDKYNATWSPYVYGGVGGSIFNPTVNGLTSPEGGPAVELTDGYYSNFHFTATGGGGVRFDFKKKFAVGLEGGIRYAFSDYLDGAGVSRDLQDNDWYYVLGVNFRYKLGTEQTIKF